MLAAAAWYALREPTPVESPGHEVRASDAAGLRPPDERRSSGGRAITFDRGPAAASPDGWKRGDTIAIPLPGGDEVIAKVNLVQTEADGTVRIGGEIANHEDGSFFLGFANEKSGGMILLHQAGLAYEIEEQADGTTIIREKPLDEVICRNMPVHEAPGEPGPMPAPEGAPPILSSRPGATAVAYLDFDGETVTDVAWNNGNTIVAEPAQMTNEEILETWSRVKEDFLPFDIDVTTNLQRYLNAPVNRRTRVIITPTNSFRPGSGGVAYVNSFSLSGMDAYSPTIPCWVFNQGIVGASETISHELGHTLGLLHDGRPGQEYYSGHGGWAPIMGAGFYYPLVQWSKGEYLDANNQEDDLALITRPQNGFGYFPDEAGNSVGTAAALVVNDGEVDQTGIITQASDSDFYALTVAQPSDVIFAASPAAISPNLDIALELQNSSGNVLASSSPDEALGAELNHQISPGTYYLKISGSGRGTIPGDGYSNYGSIGHYEIAGSLTTLDLPLITSASSVGGVTGAPFSYQIAVADSADSFGVTGTLPPGLALNGGTGLISGTPTIAGVYPLTISATNSSGTGTAPLTLTVVAGSYFANSSPITIPSSGQGNPYPSTIEVSGFSGTASKVIVRLNGLSHTWPADLDILLVGPGGQNVMLLSDTGGSFDISSVNFAFDGDAPSPPGATIRSGEFLPSDIDSDDEFPFPAPPPPYGGSLATFSGLNPNGTWKLFVFDDTILDSGTISGGWSLAIVQNPPLIVTPQTEWFSPAGGRGELSVEVGAEWSWSSNVGWLTSDFPVSSQNGYFGYTVAANIGTSPRVGTITFTSGSFSATHTVDQYGAPPEDGTRVLEQVLVDGTQSVWRSGGTSGIAESTHATPAVFQGDAFDGAGQLDVRVSDSFGTVTSTHLWQNHGIVPQTGVFSATFSTVPGSANVDTVIGFSAGTADFWDDLAAYVRFNPQGTVDARNGPAFAAVNPFTYTAGVSYLIEMEVNVVTRRYRATIMPPSGAPVVIADDFAFRTEQAGVTRLANFACLTWAGGSQTVSALTVPTLGTVTATNVWGNHPIRERREKIVASFTATPGGTAMDSVFGFSAAPADFWDDLAVYLRFNDQGRIDARNGDVFSAATVFNYSAGVPYRLVMEIDILSKTYWATVIPPGGAPVLIANGFAFRTEQAGVTQLSNFAYHTLTGGTQTVGNLVITDLGNVTANNVWANHKIETQVGKFTASFLTTPGGPAVDTTIGFSSGPADFWDDMAAYVRFSPAGKIDARSGGGFAALSDLSYTAGTTYLVEMEINPAAGTYSVNVTPAGGAPVPIAYQFPFRTEQAGVTSLSNFAYLTWAGGVQTIRNFAISGSRIDLPLLEAASAAGPLEATATAVETRVTKEIHLVAGLHATDEIVTVENLANWPRQITIQLADNYGSDGATYVHGTSSGDDVVDQNDQWFISSDVFWDYYPSNDPTLMISWTHSANLPAPRLLEVPGSGNDRLRLYFVGTIAPGESAMVTVRRQLFENALLAFGTGVPLGVGSADLAGLTLSDGALSPMFSPYNSYYHAFVANDVASVTVTPTVFQPGATVRVNGNPSPSGLPSNSIPVSFGSNFIGIQVTAENGFVIKTYFVTVERQASDLQYWRFIHFGTYENTGDAANSEDFDHDGIVNMLEYAFYTSPTDANSYYMPSGRWVGSNFQIEHFDFYNQNSFQAEWSTTLRDDDWHPATNHGDEPGEYIFRAPPGAGPRAFMRVKVVVPDE